MAYTVGQTEMGLPLLTITLEPPLGKRIRAVQLTPEWNQWLDAGSDFRAMFLAGGIQIRGLPKPCDLPLIAEADTVEQLDRLLAAMSELSIDRDMIFYTWVDTSED